MKVIDRKNTLLRLNDFKVHENEMLENGNIDEKEHEENLKNIDEIIDEVRSPDATEAKIMRVINHYGYASVDMPKYKEV